MLLESVAITAGIPMIDKIDKNPFEYIQSGDFLKVDTIGATVEIIKRK
jgi:predicted aconitase with swiveling domain